MNIPPDQWREASGSYAIAEDGTLWQIIGFIDRPAVVLRAVGDQASLKHVEIMGSETSKRFRRLLPVENDAA